MSDLCNFDSRADAVAAHFREPLSGLGEDEAVIIGGVLAALGEWASDKGVVPLFQAAARLAGLDASAAAGCPAKPLCPSKGGERLERATIIMRGVVEQAARLVECHGTGPVLNALINAYAHVAEEVGQRTVAVDVLRGMAAILEQRSAAQPPLGADTATAGSA